MENRTNRAFEMVLRGYSLKEIATELRLSLKEARRLVLEVYDQLASSKYSVRIARAIQVARLERAMSRLWDQIEAGDLKAIDRLIKLIERLSKLLGLDLKGSGDEDAGDPSIPDIRELLQDEQIRTLLAELEERLSASQSDAGGLR